jgi:hypothetical protein
MQKAALNKKTYKNHSINGWRARFFDLSCGWEGLPPGSFGFFGRLDFVSLPDGKANSAAK